ncbi:MAG: hypothetical protein ABSE73_07050 [Planctomycetota bacterium]
MAVVPAVPKEEWAALHEAAAEFKALEAWNWMKDGDLFAVLNPEKNEIGYCCVLGMRGEVFALVVYLGSEGLAVHKRMRGGLDAFADDTELTHIYKCLMASFEDWKALEKEDKAVIKSLGETFKQISGIAGGAILGDGRVALILDLAGLIKERAHE